MQNFPTETRQQAKNASVRSTQHGTWVNRSHEDSMTPQRSARLFDRIGGIF
ncbi:hypothetical protein RSSM_01622 [Rhodopirellula sallentina SM41]|uniref:Uncharacterized protein n=1 Tax=Rhodopirellula sallentina SM41 TaxID=1263870 RepID=M5UGH1_9BACT|nr:hypothetical protein RSSM_01622 [Rhodopirellula sallentina SM41]